VLPAFPLGPVFPPHTATDIHAESRDPGNPSVSIKPSSLSRDSPHHSRERSPLPTDVFMWNQHDSFRRGHTAPTPHALPQPANLAAGDRLRLALTVRGSCGTLSAQEMLHKRRPHRWPVCPRSTGDELREHRGGRSRAGVDSASSGLTTAQGRSLILGRPLAEATCGRSRPGRTEHHKLDLSLLSLDSVTAARARVVRRTQSDPTVMWPGVRRSRSRACSRRREEVVQEHAESGGEPCLLHSPREHASASQSSVRFV